MIKAAAIKSCEGLIITLLPPSRHHDILRLMKEMGVAHAFATQGFMTNENVFVTREEATSIAIASGQTTKEKMVAPPRLFSEDLW